MPVPNYQTNMRPLIEFTNDRQNHLQREAIDNILPYSQLLINMS